MDDRNNNGMVGENDKDAVNNPISAEKEVAREEVLEKEAITELPETETTTSIEGVDEKKKQI